MNGKSSALRHSYRPGHVNVSPLTMQTAVNSLRYITLIFVFIGFVAVFNIALIPNAQGGVAGFTRCYCSWHTHNEIYYGIVFIM